MFFKFVSFDIKNGLLKEWKKYLIALSVFLAFLSIHYLRIYAENSSLRASGEEELGFTVGDLLISVLGGMKVFHYGDGEAFLFPALWIFFFLLLLFFTLRYPTNDLDGMGKSMLLLSQKRQTWWFSKCVWCASFVLMYFTVFYIASFLMGICLGGEVVLQPSEYTPYALDGGMYLKDPPWDIVPGLVLIPCVSCGIALFQVALTLFIRPIFAYVISCVLFISSAYFFSPFLVGNYAMLFRTHIFLEEGVSLSAGFLAAFLLIFASIMIGYLRVERMDILTRE